MTAGILQGWKAIATFLDRDERTVRRWEKQYGLPIRRLTPDRKSVVYAIQGELEEWLLQPRVLQGDEVISASRDEPAEVSDSEIDVIVSPADPPQTTRAVPPSNRFRLVLKAALAISLFALALPAYRAITRARSGPALPSAATTTISATPDESVFEGELLLERRTPESMARAVDILSRRVEQAPASAAAYAALAKALCLAREYSSMPSSQAFPLAEDAANHALRLDENNVDAHAVLGFINFFWEWNSQVAEHEFRRAIALSPTSPLPRQWFGSMLMHQRREREALEQLSEAQRLSPSSAAIMSVRAMVLSLSGQRSVAMEILKALETNVPEALAPHRALAYVSLQAPADMPTFLSEKKQFDSLRKDVSGTAEMEQASRIYQAQGKLPMLRFLLRNEQRRARNGVRSSFRMAEFEAMLGDEDAAVSDVASAIHAHEENAIALAIDPSFERLRQIGRLDTFLRSGNLPIWTH